MTTMARLWNFFVIHPTADTISNPATMSFRIFSSRLTV